MPSLGMLGFLPPFPYILMAWHLVKHRDNCALPLQVSNVLTVLSNSKLLTLLNVQYVATKIQTLSLLLNIQYVQIATPLSSPFFLKCGTLLMVNWF
jgi:hypothetical protein